MERFMDCYKTLGLNQGASSEDIQSAFMRLKNTSDLEDQLNVNIAYNSLINGEEFYDRGSDGTVDLPAPEPQMERQKWPILVEEQVYALPTKFQHSHNHVHTHVNTEPDTSWSVSREPIWFPATSPQNTFDLSGALAWGTVMMVFMILGFIAMVMMV